MTTRLPNKNVLLIAFVAIAGMLSFAEDASACGSEPESGSSARACCAMRRSAECGCCGQVESSPPLASLLHADEVRLLPTRAGLTSEAATPSCGCRTSEPPAPSERPAQRVSNLRFEGLDREPCGIVSMTVRPSLAFISHGLPNESLLKSPLYLRTSHLLI